MSEIIVQKTPVRRSLPPGLQSNRAKPYPMGELRLLEESTSGQDCSDYLCRLFSGMPLHPDQPVWEGG